MFRKLSMLLAAALCSTPVLASEVQHLDATSTLWGYLAVFVFVIAYLVVVGEEKLQLRKSKPMLIGAGLIWLPAIFLGYVASILCHMWLGSILGVFDQF